MQAGLEHGHVGHLGGGADHRMHQTRIGIDTDVRLHAEMPDVALLRLRHFRIALAVAVLGRARRGNQGRIDQRALAKQQALFAEQGIDLSKDCFGQPLGFEQMAKVEDGRFIGDRIFAGINAGKGLHHRHVVQRFFHSGVGQGEPLLHEVDSQHHRERLGRATALGANLRSGSAVR